MRVLFVGGTGPVGRVSIPYLLAAGHEVAVAHTGAHEPDGLPAVEHLHGGRKELLSPGGVAERWRPTALIDTFAGGATAAKGLELLGVARRVDAHHIVAVSSVDVYRHCADAGVDGNASRVLARDSLPLRESAPRRTGPSPGSGSTHDNVAMEDALLDAESVTILRPGAIYGPVLHSEMLREWYLVGRVVHGEHVLPLPAGGTQIFHRTSLDLVGRAVAAAVLHGASGYLKVNVADLQDLTFGGLAALVAGRLRWEWQPTVVSWEVGDHPWNVRHPVLVDTTRLREVLKVTQPVALESTEAQIDWLWEHKSEVASLAM